MISTNDLCVIIANVIRDAGKNDLNTDIFVKRRDNNFEGFLEEVKEIILMFNNIMSRYNNLTDTNGRFTIYASECNIMYSREDIKTLLVKLLGRVYRTLSDPGRADESNNMCSLAISIIEYIYKAYPRVSLFMHYYNTLRQIGRDMEAQCAIKESIGVICCKYIRYDAGEGDSIAEWLLRVFLLTDITNDNINSVCEIVTSFAHVAPVTMLCDFIYAGGYVPNRKYALAIIEILTSTSNSKMHTYNMCILPPAHVSVSYSETISECTKIYIACLKIIAIYGLGAIDAYHNTHYAQLSQFVLMPNLANHMAGKESKSKTIYRILGDIGPRKVPYTERYFVDAMAAWTAAKAASE
jgi:hypothetical protein